MGQWVSQWWENLRIQHKVWTVLLVLCVPLVGGLATHLYFVEQLLQAQQQRHELVLAHEHVHLLRRLAVDIEDGFRGYVLTQQSIFLKPLTDAELKIDKTLKGAGQALAKLSTPEASFQPVEYQVRELLQSKHELIANIQQGRTEDALAYVRSGEGLKQSDRLRQDLRTIEDHLERRRTILTEQAEALSQQTFVALWVAVAGVLVLGWTSSRMLARSLSEPIMRLQAATATFGEEMHSSQAAEVLTPSLTSRDELGQLAEAYLNMARRIETHVCELETLNTIGQDINTIGPDGLDGALHRITDRAVELVHADVCLVLLRDERMGCWIVEAASGEWNDRLKKSVMLWEELPISVQAFDTQKVAIGEGFHQDERPQVVRRNLIGDSMIAIPLMAQGVPFGVLSLLSKQPRPIEAWNQRLAKGLAQEAALAISNVRLYEASQQKQQRLLSRLRQLEHLAETLAHDLKGPGARMEELAKLLAHKFPGQIDDRTARWLDLIQENGRDIVRRVEGILSVARVGAGQGSVTAVDPRIVIDDVLKAQAGEIEQLHATVHVDSGFPLVACHGAYLRQIFDNLISNALKYARPGESPSLTISSQTGKHMVCFTVRDQGVGIPEDQRARVFQPFVRLEQTPASGSGIGLAIVQRIVELYGGRVWIEGAVGEGCTVKFTIPWLNQEPGPAAYVRPEAMISDLIDVPQNDFI